MSLKKLFALLFICLTFTGISAAHADDKEEASAFANNLGHKALSVITDKDLSKDEKREQLETLFEQNVDIDWIGKFVLGRFWKDASDEQKKEYLTNYRSFTIKHYTKNLSDFTNADFEVSKVKPDDKGGYIVSMRIKRPQAEDVITQFDVRPQTNSGLKVYDIIVEGVSMITTQRSEFSSVVSSKGLDYLIHQLEQRSQNDPGVADKAE